MLNVFDEARDKIAEIIFRVDKDRQGRKFLAVKDQNTVKRYRNRRLMSLVHFFLLHRYKTDLVHYVTPSGDNRLSVQRMIHNGVFRCGADRRPQYHRHRGRYRAGAKNLRQRRIDQTVYRKTVGSARRPRRRRPGASGCGMRIAMRRRARPLARDFMPPAVAKLIVMR